jgi:hypothetical protein
MGQWRKSLISELDGLLTNNITFICYCFNPNMNASSYIPAYLPSIHSARICGRPPDKSRCYTWPLIVMIQGGRPSAINSVPSRTRTLAQHISMSGRDQRLWFPFPQSIPWARNVAIHVDHELVGLLRRILSVLVSNLTFISGSARSVSYVTQADKWQTFSPPGAQIHIRRYILRGSGRLCVQETVLHVALRET